MFDIQEYYTNSIHVHEDDYLVNFDAIEDDISNDVKKIVSSRDNSAYLTDCFKYRSHRIDILYPKLEYPGKKTLLKGPDHIRFWLSVYPLKKNLHKINKIVLRPKHIEINNIELMALYIRELKTLVHYLYYPHSYNVDSEFLNVHKKFMPYDLTRMVDNNYLGLGKKSDENSLVIPPLLYFISTIKETSCNDIDKFFLRLHTSRSHAVLKTLDEISYHYSRNGY
jgi:hypothetical protein